jgi:ubiquinone/menaquinone biosynthesis C-methylase UbiE
MANEAVAYEYRGLMASTWDLLRGDTSRWPDRSFFLEVIRASGQPALDVGCGSGRLLLDYLARGIDVDGVDISPEMLELCRQKAEQGGLKPALFQQEMETLDLPRRYRTIIVPSSSFQLLTEPATAAGAMKRFFDHLAPGGMLVMPFMVLWTGSALVDSVEVVEGEWKQVAERARPEDGALVRRWSRSTYDLAGQLEHSEDRYEVRRGDEVIAYEEHRRSPATRWYTQEQATTLYRQAGFDDVRLVSGFTWQPAKPDDTLFCVMGMRPR